MIRGFDRTQISFLREAPARRHFFLMARACHSSSTQCGGQLTGPRVVAVRGSLTSKYRARMPVTPKLSRRLVCMVA